MPGKCHLSTAIVISTVTGLTSELDGVSSVNSPPGRWVQATIFTSEESESLREAGDFPTATGTVREWGLDGLNARTSAPSTLPNGHDGLGESLRLTGAAALQGQGRVLSPQKLPSERRQAYF